MLEFWARSKRRVAAQIRK